MHLHLILLSMIFGSIVLGFGLVCMLGGQELERSRQRSLPARRWSQKQKLLRQKNTKVRQNIEDYLRTVLATPSVTEREVAFTLEQTEIIDTRVPTVAIVRLIVPPRPPEAIMMEEQPGGFWAPQGFSKKDYAW